jgi:UDP-glucose 4-epimerase
MRVLITGGAGFIGSHLADHYVNTGHTVTLLDNFSTGSKSNIAHLDDKVTIVNGDIRNIDLIDQLTKDSEQVLHMAAALGVNTILESPLESMSTNITGSEVVLNAAAKHNKRIRTQSSPFQRQMIELLELHRRFVGHTAMPKQLKKPWHLLCTKKRSFL